MNRRWRAFLAIATLVVVLILLVWLFPRAVFFVELAARELRTLWWLILIVVLAVWLIWGVGRRPKR